MKASVLYPQHLTVQKIKISPTLDFNSLIIALFVRMATDLLTSTIMWTVGRVDATFCGWGGLIGTGTQPEINREHEH